ncbi:hypothetical protein SAMN04487762_0770 [Polaribacter sp. Hel1_33_78]|jgi:hypothetical protein|nr:hypothetical protein ATE90_1927 [Polaribacter sp. Hel1_33_96]SDT94208.1 hypothetical protein SAMN04487762_0770 [Polaribacter sp. Hel1_33_78]
MKGEINKVCMNDIITLDIANQLIQQKKKFKRNRKNMSLITTILVIQFIITVIGVFIFSQYS